MIDKQWVLKFLMVPNYDDAVTKTNYAGLHPTLYKISDTSLGGNSAMNPPPQLPPSCDIRSTVHTASGKGYIGDDGMGRWYSDVIDANAQIIHMRMGVPQFNSLTHFFGNFYDHKAASLARTGRGDIGLFETAGKLAGSVLVAPFLPLMWIGDAYRAVTAQNPTKFYYMKEDMALYWTAANNIANMLSVNAGMGGIDLFKIVGKMQATASKDIKTNGIPMLRDMGTPAGQFKEKDISTSDIVGDYSKSKYGGAVRETGKDGMDVESFTENKSWIDSFIGHSNKVLDSGTQFVSFRVRHTGEVTDNFSNQTVEPGIKSRFNSTSSSMMSKRFDLAEGNIGDGIITGTIESIAGSVRDFANGFLEAIQLDGLVALAGNSFVDVPDRWQDSIANLQSMSYTIDLKTPYGNPISRLNNLLIPLSMLLAAALPKAGGPAAYTWPFLIELYDKGRAQTRMGIIESMTIARGDGNVGWTQGDEPLSITVTINVKELSSVMMMPISMNPGIFDPENSFQDYMASLASLDVYHQAYSIPRIKMQMARSAAEFQKYVSPAFWAETLGGTAPGRLIAAARRNGLL